MKTLTIDTDKFLTLQLVDGKVQTPDQALKAKRRELVSHLMSYIADLEDQTQDTVDYHRRVIDNTDDILLKITDWQTFCEIQHGRLVKQSVLGVPKPADFPEAVPEPEPSPEPLTIWPVPVNFRPVFLSECSLLQLQWWHAKNQGVVLRPTMCKETQAGWVDERGQPYQPMCENYAGETLPPDVIAERLRNFYIR